MERPYLSGKMTFAATENGGMTMWLIDADKLPRISVGLCDADGNMYGAGEIVLAEDIDKATTITPESLAVHGRWRQLPSNGIGGTAQCSICEKSIYGYRAFCYCPMCGAKIDLEE